MAAFAGTSRGSSFSGGYNVAFISRSFYFRQEQRPPPASRHAIVAFLVTVLVNFLQLKYQGKDVSSLETYRKTIWVAVASLLVYCLAYDAEQRFCSDHPTPAYAGVVRRGMVLFGSLSWVSLASILLPDSIRPVLFLLYGLFSAGVLLKFRLQALWNWLRLRTRGDLSGEEWRIGRALINPIWSMANAYTDRGGLLPV